jgi:hypothetical protein
MKKMNLILVVVLMVVASHANVFAEVLIVPSVDFEAKQLSNYTLVIMAKSNAGEIVRATIGLVENNKNPAKVVSFDIIDLSVQDKFEAEIVNVARIKKELVVVEINFDASTPNRPEPIGAGDYNLSVELTLKNGYKVKEGLRVVKLPDGKMLHGFLYRSY